MAAKKHLKIGFRVFISTLLIAFLLFKQDLGGLKEALQSFNIFYLFAALLLQILGTYVSSLRWREILKTSNLDVPTNLLFTLYTEGYFYNNFLPTQMGGDVYKSIALGNSINDQSTSLFSVFMDRFGGLIVLLIMALMGIGSLYGVMGIFLSVIILIVGLVLYFPVLKFAAKKIKFLHNFKSASDVFMQRKKEASVVLGYSVLVQLISFAGLYLLFLGLGIKLELWSVLAYMPLTSLAALIPSFNGFGTQETVYAYLFPAAGVTVSISVAASLLIHCVRLIMSLIGGIFMLFAVHDKFNRA